MAAACPAEKQLEGTTVEREGRHCDTVRCRMSSSDVSAMAGICLRAVPWQLFKNVLANAFAMLSRSRKLLVAQRFCRSGLHMCGFLRIVLPRPQASCAMRCDVTRNHDQERFGACCNVGWGCASAAEATWHFDAVRTRWGVTVKCAAVCMCDVFLWDFMRHGLFIIETILACSRWWVV